MTEAEWLASNFPDFMMSCIEARASNRKRRLFACACCRRIWHLLRSAKARKAVAVAELFSDGQASLKALQAVHDSVPDSTPWRGDCDQKAQSSAISAAKYTTSPSGWYLESASRYASEAVEYYVGKPTFREQAAHAALLRDIFPNPFRPAPTLDPAWLRWHDATMPRLAQQMYDSRDFASMPILADALEEAGCTNAHILEHCRGPGPHVRGCFVVDLLLGKE